MSLKQSHKPDGYKELLIYQKADTLLSETTAMTGLFPKSKTMSELADQMNRSARSVKQNIAEGWTRNKTRDYNEFLGYSIASCYELKEDAEDIWVGKYKEPQSVKGIVGDKRVEGVKKGIKGDPSQRRQWLQSLKFYPLDGTLPPVIQLYLRAAELCYLIDKTQRSLQGKMKGEYGHLTKAEHLRQQEIERGREKNDFKRWLDENGKVFTARGVKDKAEAQRLGLEEIDPPG